MNRGRIEETGPATAVLQRPQAAFTRVLLAAVPRLGPPASPRSWGAVTDGAGRAVADSQRRV
jgi:peptide/nickel transport system ATP-binding protein